MRTFFDVCAHHIGSFFGRFDGEKKMDVGNVLPLFTAVCHPGGDRVVNDVDAVEIRDPDDGEFLAFPVAQDSGTAGSSRVFGDIAIR